MNPRGNELNKMAKENNTQEKLSYKSCSLSALNPNLQFGNILKYFGPPYIAKVKEAAVIVAV